MFTLPLFLVLVLWSAIVSGTPQHEHQRYKRVVNGVTTEIETIPYQVALVFDDFPVCCGAIIAEDVIITAAHCLRSYPPNLTVIYAGMKSKENITWEPGLEIKDFIVHELYNYTGQPTPDDIALIILKENLTFGDTIQKIDLVEDEYELPITATVSGWGSTGCNYSLSEEDACDGSYAQELQSGNLTISRRENGLIYAPRTEVTANYGDSGGPIVANNKLIGISRNVDIVEPNIFDFDGTSVLDYLPWIRENLESLQRL